jgi:hypothetical protein
MENCLQCELLGVSNSFTYEQLRDHPTVLLRDTKKTTFPLSHIEEANEYRKAFSHPSTE